MTAELFSEDVLLPDDEDSPEEMAEIQIARTDYEADDYTTFDQYSIQRADRFE